MTFIKNFNKPLPKLSTEDLSKYTGTYAFSPGRNLRIRKVDEGFYMEISQKVFSPIYVGDNNHFKTEIPQLSLTFDTDRELLIRYPDGNIRKLPKLAKEKPDAVELAYSGSMDEVATAFKNLQLKCPDCVLHKDHTMASLALQILYDLRPIIGAEKARERAKAILNLAIQLNPENHEFAAESLRYY